MEKQKNQSRWTVDVLFGVGALLIALGVGLWSLPAGLVTAGAFCLAGSVLVDFSAKADKEKAGEGG